ncbi:nonribosomal peptide synthase 11, partial [Aureobasidium melanogenum]
MMGIDFMQALWAQILDLDNDFDPDADFWDLGGDSLAAMTLSALLSAKGFKLSVADIFRHSSLKSMAQAVTVISLEAGPENFDIPPMGQDTLTQVCKDFDLDPNHIDFHYPCTPMQEGLMMLAAQYPGSYTAQQTFELPDNIDLKRLSVAIANVTKLLPILRTIIVQDHAAKSWQCVLVRGPDCSEAGSLTEYLTADSKMAMQYGTPLSRFAIISDPQRSSTYLVWTLHHALFDRWSLPMMLNHIASAYLGETAPLTRSMQSFVCHLRAQARPSQEEFWRVALEGVEPSTFPPRSDFANAVPSSQYDFVVPVSTRPRVVTLSTVLRAAWGLLLSHYSHTQDVLYGLTLSGRNVDMPGVELVCGPTISTVPLRVKVDPGESVERFLKRLQQQTTDMIPHEHLGLQHIARISPDTRAATEFRSLLVIQPPEGDAQYVSVFGHRSTYETSSFHTYPLVLECTMGDDHIDLHIDFDSASISKAQIELIAHQMGHLTDQLLHTELCTPLRELVLTSEADVSQIMEWNRCLPQEVHSCVHTLVASRAVSHGSDVAIASHDGQITYSQLDLLSSSLAQQLQSVGVGIETTVAVCFEKSYRMIIAMLAVMKAGGCFVPIDVEHPETRRREISLEAEIRFAIVSPLTKSSCIGLVPKIIVFDNHLEAKLEADQGTYRDIARPENALYIMYTSGSTGKPKGVQIEHKAFCSGALSRANALKRNRGTRILQYSNIVFDTSMEDIITTLLTGGCICVPNEEDRLNRLAHAMEELDVNYAHLTPSTIKFLNPSDVPSLRTLCLGGERISSNNITAWSSAVDLLLTYGPSEGCVTQTVAPKASLDTDPTCLGFGYGARFWIVDPENPHRLSPVGAVGELLLEGPLLARGYLKQPEKTTTSFVTGLAFAGETGASRRFYKTGDLVRYGLDGSFFFHARKDNQVKHHGQRVELGEIEYHISAHPRVRHAVVCLPTAGKCAGRLTAVLSSSNTSFPISTNVTPRILSRDQSSRAPPINEIRQGLTDLLPSYMVPNLWLVVDSIPITSSGKVNRSHLMQWLSDLTDYEYQQAILDVVGESRETPINPRESLFRDLCGQILNLPVQEIGMGQSFTRLGGDSISAMQLVARCRAQKIHVKVKDILRARSLRETVASTRDLAESVAATPARPLASSKIPITPIQKLFFTNDGHEASHYNQSFFLKVAGDRITIESLRAALSYLIQKHPMLRSHFSRTRGTGWMTTIADQAPKPIAFETGGSRSMSEVTDEIQELQKLTNLRSGPIIIAASFQIEGLGQAICIIAHHLVVDYVSWRIMIGDLEAYLRRSSLTTESPTTFAEWVTAMQDTLAKVELADAPKEIKADDARNCAFWDIDLHSNTYADVLHVLRKVNTQATANILRSTTADPLDIFLAAIVISFGQTFPSRRPPIIFNEIHGREPLDTGLDLSSIVGWFTSLTPIHVAASPDSTLTEMAQTIHQIRMSDSTDGLGFLSSQFDQTNAAATESHCFELIVNYEGLYQQLERSDSMFKALPKHYTDISGDMHRSSLLEIDMGVQDGQLQLSLAFNKHMANHACFDQWMNLCSSILQQYGLSSEQSESREMSNGLTLVSSHSQPCLHQGQAIQDSYACTPLQLGMLMSLAKQEQNYNDIIIARVNSSSPNSGTLDIAHHLKHAWLSLVRRHDALRTVFVPGSDDVDLFKQVVLQDPVIIAVILDASDEKSASQHLRALSVPTYSTESIQHRLTILPTLNGSVLFRLDICHTIFDGFSLNSVILPELCLAIEASSSGAPDLQIEHVSSIHDFVEHLKSVSRPEATMYWQEYLAGCSPSLLTMGGTEHARELKMLEFDIGCVDEIRGHCEQHGLTTANFIMAAWAVLLSTFCGSRDVVFGYLVSGRDVEMDGISDVVGPLANILPFRIQLEDQTPILELLRTVQDDYFETQGRQHVGLSNIQKGLHLGMSTIFNTLVSVQAANRTPAAGTITIDIQDNIDPTEYDVALGVSVSPAKITCRLEYWTTCLTDQQAGIIASSFTTLLTGLATRFESDLSRIEVTGHASDVLLQKWNSHTWPEDDRYLHEVIHRQAQLRPNAPAVCAWDGDLSYEQFNRVTESISKRLRAFGVGLGSQFVPVCMQKSLWVPVAMIAILKAGGKLFETLAAITYRILMIAYAQVQSSPLIQLIPKHGYTIYLTRSLLHGKVDRILVLDDDSMPDVPLSFTEKAPAISTTVSYVDTYSSSEGSSPATLSPSSQTDDDDFGGSVTTPISLDCQVEYASGYVEEQSTTRSKTTADSLAYICFTSGSTGRPKGVMITHKAFCTSALARAPAIERNATSRVLQFTSLMFDASLEDILTTLMTGGCICMPSEFERWNDIPGAVRRMNVNCADITPSLATSLEPGSVPSISTLIVGGELLSRSILETWSPRTKLLITYGPTEASCVTTCTLPKLTTDDPANIGHVIGGFSWIVDPENPHRLLPVGAIGELLIEGSLLAMGYLCNPTATSQAFVTRLAWAETGSNKPARRFYRTGDLAKFNLDGSLQFIGRRDSQFKINGQRVELDEIQVALSKALPDNPTAVLAVQFESEHTRRIAAFVTTAEAGSSIIDTTSMHDSNLQDLVLHAEHHVAKVLPSYMVPSVFIPVHRLPLTTTGKLDRQYLLHQLKSKHFNEYSSWWTKSITPGGQPMTYKQKQLRDLWAAELKINPTSISVQSSWFRLGGDSVAAIRLVRKARDAGCGLTVSTIFRHPRLCDMADHFDTDIMLAEVNVQPYSLLPPGIDIGEIRHLIGNDYAELIEDAYPCTPMQEGLFVQSLRRGGAYVSKQKFCLSADVNVVRFQRAWEQTFSDCAILRTRICVTKDMCLQVVLREHLHWKSGHPNADQAELQVEPGSALCQFWLEHSQGTNEHTFTLFMHHALFDAISIDNIFRHAMEVYEREGNPVSRTKTFNRFVKYAIQETRQPAIDYWSSKLTGIDFNQFPALPSVSYAVKADKVVTHRPNLLELSSRERKLPPSVLAQAAWALVVAIFTNNPAVTFGITNSGRNAHLPGVDMICGPTLTTIPTCLTVDMEMSVERFLGLVQTEVADAIPHEQLGLHHISRLHADSAEICRFQSLLVVQNHETDAPGWLGVEELQAPENLASFNSYALMLTCNPIDSTFITTASFDHSVITERQVVRLTEYFSDFVSQLQSADPNTPLKNLSFVLDSDKALIASWQRPLPLKQDISVSAVVSAQCLSSPLGTAIEAWDGIMSYETLELEFSKLAQALLTLGLEPGDRISLCFSKSKWVVVAMLGVLKAGCVMVPLDLAHPKTRLQQICQAANSKIVLTSTHSFFEVEEKLVRVIAVDTLIASQNVQPFVGAVALPLDAEAYIIFTSGTTGAPKGIVMSHAAVCTQTPEYARATNMSSQSRVLQFSSYSFDVSMQEILGTLFVGGCVCIPSEESRLDNISGAIRSLRVNWVMLMASVAELLDLAIATCLDTLVIGGEMMSQSLLDRWVDKVQLYTTYGPTEACVTCVTRQLSVENCTANIIGLPIGCRTWIMNQASSAPTPVGAVGELYIEGPLLATSYLDDQTRTSHAFVTLSPTIERAYRTGDLVKLTENGELLILGRSDAQVKIRGHRIELDEIAYRVSCLAPDQRTTVDVVQITGFEHPTVAVFMAPKDKIMSSFDRPSEVLVNFADASHLENLRERFTTLETQLPSYMVPTLYIPVDQIPVTSTGKTDHRALRRAAAALSHSQVSRLQGQTASIRQPTSELESVLQRLVAQSLQVEAGTVCVARNIFTMGADSITAMKLVAAAGKCDINLTVADVFGKPSIRDLAAHAQRQTVTTLTSTIPAYSLFNDPPSALPLLDDIQTTCHIPIVDLEDAYPCTEFQEGLIALSLKEPGSFVSQQLYRLPRGVDVLRLKASVDAALATSVLFRTTFVATQSFGIVQCVLKKRTMCQEITSLNEYLAKDTAQPMHFGERFCRGAVMGDVEGPVLVLTMHHAIYDATTIQNLLRAIRDSYEGCSLPLSVPFNCFVQAVSQTNAKSSHDWWTRYLADVQFEHFPELGHTAIAHDTNSRSHHRTSRTIHANVDNNLGFTRPTLLRAAWALVQSTFTTSSDVVFGVVSSGRNALAHPVASVAGPTLSVMPFRTSVDNASSVHDFLSMIQSNSTAMMYHEQLGLRNIADLSDSARAACDFRSLLLIQNEPDKEFLQTQSWISPFEHPSQKSSFSSYPLDLECIPQEKEIRINASYDPTYLTPSQLDRIFSQLEHVYQGLLSSAADVSLDALCTLSPTLVEEISTLASAVELEAHDRCIHSLVEETVYQHPHAPAICWEDGVMSYQELYSHAQSLAAFLQARFDIGAGSIVPLCFERSRWAIVSMLAVLLAGGAYTSLDPTYPASRLSAIIDSTKASLALVSAKHADVLHGILFDIIVPELRDTGSFGGGLDPSFVVDPRETAIVNFTSGSTGLPKGIILSHTAISSSLLSHGKAMDLSPRARVLAFAAFTFDVSNSDIFATLVHGGCICMPGDERRVNDLAGAIRDFHVTHACLTSSVAATLQPKEVPTLKTLTLGGEPLAKAEVLKWANQVRLNNIYGPAECAIWCMMSSGLDQDSDATNIGYGMNSRAWIIHPDNPDKLQPLGVPGELAISGPLLATGYLKLPEKTATAFAESLAWTQDGQIGSYSRVYRTGDMAKLNEDGSVSFVGRRDTQVKLRGQRIELGDVQFHMQRALPDHEIAIEVLKSPGNNEQRLVGFICVPSAPADTNDHEYLFLDNEASDWMRTHVQILTNFLKTELPAYMLPWNYLPLRKLPLSTSGKLDRRVLAELASANMRLIYHPELALEAKTAPRSPEERNLREIWSEVLGLPVSDISILDDFFALSGDSIKAMRVAAIARRQNMIVSVADHFKLRTIAALAHASRPAGEVSPDDSPLYDRDTSDLIVGIRGLTRDDVDGIVPALSFQALTAALSMATGRQFVNYFSVKWTQRVDARRMKAALQEVVSRFSILRTVFGFKQKSLQQIILRAASSDFQEIQAPCFSSTLLHHLAFEDQKQVRKPLDLQPGFFLIQSRDSSYLVMRISHAHYDGVSLPIIWDSIQTAYSHGDLTHPKSEFAGFSRFVEESSKDSALAYWKSVLMGSSMTRVTTSEYPSYNPEQNEVQSRKIDMPRHPDPAITTATLLKVAWAMVLSQSTGDNDVVFGHLVSGRHLGVDNMDSLLGPCVNVIPVRVQVNSGSTSQELLHQLQRQQVEGLPHEHLGHQDIVRECTDWPIWTRYSTMVQHQSHITGVALGSGQQWIPTEEVFVPPVLVHDICVITVPHDGRLQVNMSYSSPRLSNQTASKILDCLCSTMRVLSLESHEEPCPGILSPCLPDATESATKLSYPEQVRETFGMGSDAMDVVMSVWTAALELTEAVADLDMQEPLCADPIIAANVLLRYQRLGLAVTFEDILAHPTAGQQVRLLSQVGKVHRC